MRNKSRGIFFSVGTQICAIVITVLVLMLSYSLVQQKITNRFNSQFQFQTTRMNILSNMKNSITEAQKNFSSYLFSGNPYYLNQYHINVHNAGKDHESYSEYMREEEELFLSESLKNTMRTYRLECQKANEMYIMKDHDYYSKIYALDKISSYMIRYTDELMELAIQDSIDTNRAMNTQVRIFNGISLAAIPLLLIVVIFCIHYIIRNLSHPMSQLISQATEISKGNYQARNTRYNPNNSVGLLAETLNNMSSDIERAMTELNEKVETEQKLFEEQKKNLEYENRLNKAHFSALQTQTNPHFLFNTLNSISRTITLGKQEQSLEMLSSLSDLLRYSLGDGDMPAVLSEEMEITMQYLRIQQYRFGDRINVKTNIPVDIMDTQLLPRFTLQPIVENAIIHGLEPRIGGGIIVIDAKKRGHDIILRIMDNGVGMSPERLALVRDRNVRSKRIGLENTRERMVMFTKDENAFDIISREGCGTMVILRFRGK